MTQTAPGTIEERGDVVAGPVRTPHNLGQGVDGSIHDDKTAQKLGFKGGTVAGSIHMEQFPPLLMHLFGNRWWERGSLSTYFRNATVHGEAVQAYAGRASQGGMEGATDAQVGVWMERVEDAAQVLEGTASVGDPTVDGKPVDTFIAERLRNLPERGDTRILAGFEPGMAMAARRVRIDPERQARRLSVITEPLDWYEGSSPWGGEIATPSTMVGLLRGAEPEMAVMKAVRAMGAVGLFGAIELRNVHGPVLVDHEYDCDGRILAVVETPKSEYFWYESWVEEPSDGRRVAEMRMMLRFMKASAPVWQ